MQLDNNSNTKRFQELLGELGEEIKGLKKDLQNLEKENNRLRIELKEVEANHADVFSELEETERMAMKHQIKGLISKIDEHLDETA